jgi:5-methyltetrahydrofolate--homocysteine methyltransferase
MTTSDRPPQQAASQLRAALAQRVVVADGAMGTMLQASPATLGDFDGHEGCNEILNLTRPDIVRSIHDAYLEAGVDCITTNTFGANLGNLGEYGLQARIEELSEAGARIARAAAGAASTGRRPRWVLGSIGPGTKLPTLGHVRFADLRDAYQRNAAGLLRGGVDAIVVETCQDLLQAKAAVIGARRAMAAVPCCSAARSVPRSPPWSRSASA